MVFDQSDTNLNIINIHILKNEQMCLIFCIFMKQLDINVNKAAVQSQIYCLNSHFKMLFCTSLNMHVDKRFYNRTCFVFMASGLLNAKGKRLISFSNLF